MKITFLVLLLLNIVWGSFMMYAGFTSNPFYFVLAAINLGAAVVLWSNRP